VVLKPGCITRKLLCRHLGSEWRVNIDRQQWQWIALLLPDTKILHDKHLIQYCHTSIHCVSQKKLVRCGTDGRLLLSGFQALVTLIMTLTLDQVIRHTVMHQSLTTIYIPNFIEIGKTFLDELTAGTPPSSRLRDTKTMTSIKNPAQSNLDIVL